MPIRSRPPLLSETWARMNSNRQTARRRGAVIKREKIGFLYLALQAGFAPRELLLRHKESLDRPTAASETQRTASQAARCCFCICWEMLFLHLLGTGGMDPRTSINPRCPRCRIYVMSRRCYIQATAQFSSCRPLLRVYCICDVKIKESR